MLKMDYAEKAFELQRQVRDNTKTLQSYLTDLQNWESEMKRKEAAIHGDFEQDLPPVRSKVKKERPLQVKKKPGKRIASYDYQSWDSFDVDKACEEVDMEDIGPTSLDSKKSQQEKKEKLREEAQYEKLKGNNYVKSEKWDEAIKCYNRAIELVKDDAIYYANRGLCYLKKESLHQAEIDCTEALKLDPTYVKALQRRATAREKLGSLKAASLDLLEIIKLESNNIAARKQLEAIKTRMGTKGIKSKSSPSSTPITENKPITNTSNPKSQPKIVELSDEPMKTVKKPDPLEKWRGGIGENITVIKTVKKPPHLRSKTALKPVPIQEILLGKTSPEKPATRLKIIEVEDSLGQGDTNNNDSIKVDETSLKKMNANGDEFSAESEKLVKDVLIMEKDINNMVPPSNSVQFMVEWKNLRGNDRATSDYLTIIEPSKLPQIFENSLESDVLSDIIRVLHYNTDNFRVKTISSYLKGLCRVKRFSALAMFLSRNDKEMLTNLLKHCKSFENCTDEEIADLKNKYEL